MIRSERAPGPVPGVVGPDGATVTVIGDRPVPAGGAVVVQTVTERGVVTAPAVRETDGWSARVTGPVEVTQRRSDVRVPCPPGWRLWVDGQRVGLVDVSAGGVAWLAESGGPPVGATVELRFRHPVYGPLDTRGQVLRSQPVGPHLRRVAALLAHRSRADEARLRRWVLAETSAHRRLR